MDKISNERLIEPDQKVDDVLARYPTTSLVFVQYGRMHVDTSDPMFHLFPTYPSMTVGEYIASNRLNKETMLRLLNAAAESEEYSKRNTVKKNE